MISENKITEIFCLADDFCKYFFILTQITILILFHSKGFRE